MPSRPTPEQIALKRIEECKHSGESFLLLSDLNLHELPTEIGQLTQLTTLDLGNNQLTTLPAEVWQLTQLDMLTLGINQLTALPPEIGQLIKLRSLALFSNRLTTVPAEIGQLTQLTMLYLGYNQLTTLPAEIGQLTQLTRLFVNDNQLTALPVELRELHKLTHLVLHGNPSLDLPPDILGPTWREGSQKEPASPRAILDYYFRTAPPSAADKEHINSVAEQAGEHWKAKRYPEAKAAFEELLTLALPSFDRARTLANLMQVCEEMGDAESAALRAEQALEIVERFNLAETTDDGAFMRGLLRGRIAKLRGQGAAGLNWRQITAPLFGYFGAAVCGAWLASHVTMTTKDGQSADMRMVGAIFGAVFAWKVFAALVSPFPAAFSAIGFLASLIALWQFLAEQRTAIAFQVIGLLFAMIILHCYFLRLRLRGTVDTFRK
jgi:tetratricopeptide (TPR) repeat protein